jgi:Ni,Fe-hydrogenase III large subunit
MIDYGADYGIDMDARDEQVAKNERNRIINLLKTIVKEAGDAHGERQMYRADDVLECINLIQHDSMPEDSHCDCCD